MVGGIGGLVGGSSGPGPGEGSSGPGPGDGAGEGEGAGISGPGVGLDGVTGSDTAFLLGSPHATRPGAGCCRAAPRRVPSGAARRDQPRRLRRASRALPAMVRVRVTTSRTKASAAPKGQLVPLTNWS